ncbi:hypothetical protein CGRA01v4_12921 [Colletotrichum graminicola]|nr:hypothetical protein CGRA01v4_12921 [Colletotrichum graminicola]
MLSSHLFTIVVVLAGSRGLSPMVTFIPYSTLSISLFRALFTKI